MQPRYYLLFNYNQIFAQRRWFLLGLHSTEAFRTISYLDKSLAQPASRRNSGSGRIWNCLPAGPGSSGFRFGSTDCCPDPQRSTGSCRMKGRMWAEVAGLGVEWLLGNSIGHSEKYYKVLVSVIQMLELATLLGCQANDWFSSTLMALAGLGLFLNKMFK